MNFADVLLKINEESFKKLKEYHDLSFFSVKKKAFLNREQRIKQAWDSLDDVWPTNLFLDEMSNMPDDAIVDPSKENIDSQFLKIFYALSNFLADIADDVANGGEETNSSEPGNVDNNDADTDHDEDYAEDYEFCKDSSRLDELLKGCDLDDFIGYKVGQKHKTLSESIIVKDQDKELFVRVENKFTSARDEKTNKIKKSILELFK